MADFLDQTFPEEPQVEPEAIAPEPVLEPVAEAIPPEPVAPEVHEHTAPDKPEPGFIPIAALMDERDKRRSLEERIRQFESQQQTQAQPEMPDPYDSPAEFVAAQQALVDQRITQVRFEMSDRFAKQAHGEEKVSQAVEWARAKAEADPVFAAGYMRDPDPIGWIVKQHDRDGLVSQIGDRSIDDFVKDYISKNPGIIGVPAPAAVAPVAATLQPAPKTAMPPRSIASDSSPISAKEPAAPADFSAIFQR